MTIPSPPPAFYPAMHTRVGYVDGSVLYEAQLDALGADVIAQDGNGNVQEIQSIRIGNTGFVTVDNFNGVWITFNAFFYSDNNWYPVNTAQPSYAFFVSASQVGANYAPPGATAITWQSLFFQSIGSGTFTSISTSIASLLSSIASINTSIATLNTEYLGLITPGPEQWRNIAGTATLNSSDRNIIINVSSGPATITLPTTHQSISIFGPPGLPGNNATIIPDAGTINGNANFIMNTPYQSNTFKYDIIYNLWRVI